MLLVLAGDVDKFLVKMTFAETPKDRVNESFLLIFSKNVLDAMLLLELHIAVDVILRAVAVTGSFQEEMEPMKVCVFSHSSLDILLSKFQRGA